MSEYLRAQETNRKITYDGCDRVPICPICKQSDKAKNMVRVTIEMSNRKWLGKAHMKCIKEYNRTHDTKYSVREYDEDSKFLGKTTPV